jgi:hypothetical protein
LQKRGEDFLDHLAAPLADPWEEARVDLSVLGAGLEAEALAAPGVVMRAKAASLADEAGEDVL